MGVRKGQFAVEFAMLFVIAVLIFLLILGISTLFVDESRQKAEQDKLELVAEKITKEILLAKESGSIFETTFTLPPDLKGTDYTIVIDADKRLIVRHTDLDLAVIRDVPELTSSVPLVPGNTYKIKKTAAGDITIEV